MAARWTRDHRGERTDACRTQRYLPGYHTEKYRRNEREKSKRGGKSASFSLGLCVSVTPPPLEVTGDLDKEERRVGRSGNDLGAGPMECDGGINERLREEGFFAEFTLLSSARPKSRGS
jgi:hypothetical protein